MTPIFNVEGFVAFFPSRVARGAKQFKRYVVKQTPGDAVGLTVDSFYDGGIQGFCFGFPTPGDLETLMNFTRRSLFKKLQKTFRLPFYIGEAPSQRTLFS